MGANGIASGQGSSALPAQFVCGGSAACQATSTPTMTYSIFSKNSGEVVASSWSNGLDNNQGPRRKRPPWTRIAKGRPVWGQIVEIDDGKIKDHLGELVRGTVEETLNQLLEADSELLPFPQRSLAPDPHRQPAGTHLARYPAENAGRGCLSRRELSPDAGLCPTEAHRWQSVGPRAVPEYGSTRSDGTGARSGVTTEASHHPPTICERFWTLLSALEEPKQVSCLYTGSAGERRRPDLAVEPDQRLVVAAHANVLCQIRHLPSVVAYIRTG